MPRLLVVHHTTSPVLAELFDAVVSGATDESIQGVEVVRRPALAANAVDALEADGYLLGTPVNIGYLSGALKHFFDLIYYPALDATRGRPFGYYLHGNSDTAGAQRAMVAITTGLGWREVHAPAIVVGSPSKADVESCWDLGATLAAVLAEGI